MHICIGGIHIYMYEYLQSTCRISSVSEYFILPLDIFQPISAQAMEDNLHLKPIDCIY